MNRYYTDEDKGITAKRGNGRSMPPAYIFVEHEDGSIHLQDGHTLLMTKEDMLDIVYGMMKFIENDITDSEIKKHNSETLDEEMLRAYGPDWKEEQPKSAKSAEPQLMKKSEGWVYFLKADNGLTKIGRTKDLKKRMYHFTVKLPYELELIHAIKSNYTVELEEQLHGKYNHLRVRGEWFNLNDEIIEEICIGY
ncbi:GIY-YIG nuclease family protein [Exiguobacterium artemiae]|uniref:GIY-YIG nuclease family protein n=1 Tax=Exiguobacterium artemiae TaxID=340145 RepID=UPI000684D81C|nr:GIY-YIG nuclease family protein [Exiguobacterium sibiricum]